jgi:PAS domain S-box-containing protein
MQVKRIKSTIEEPVEKQVQEDLYRSLFENVHDGIYQSTVDGKIITANPALVKMLGYESQEELKKMNIGGDIYVQSVEREAFVRQLEEKGRLKDVELVLKKKDGSHIIVLENAHSVSDKNGDILYYEGTLTEITARKHAEEQLMLLKHSVDVHYDGAYWMDPDSRIVYVNDAGCKVSGYTREELIGKHVKLLNIMATDKVMNLIWGKLRKDGSFTAESVHRRKDGSTYPVEIVSTYVKFGGKEYNCGFARDITDRKRAAEDMRLHLEQLRQIIDLVPSYIFAKDIDGKFLLANQAVADVFGLSPDEIQGKNDSDYGASEEQIEGYRKADMAVIEKGIPLQIPEEQILRKDGTLGWFQTVKIPYSHPGYDKLAILGVATEITERKEVEDELRKSERRFRRLFESHSAVKLIIDPDTGSIVDANNAAAEYFGWSVAKLRKMNLSEIAAGTPEEIRSMFEKAARNKGIFFEATNRLADGSLRDVEVFTSKIEIDGSYYFHSIVHDITEKKKILADLIAAKEKAEESDRLKTAFLHNISHEIRTPMNAIVGFTSLLETSGLSDEIRRQYIDIVYQNSNQLLSIITDIVDISNIESGHVKIAFTEVNINTLVKNIYEQLHIKAEQQHLDFSLHTVLPDTEAKLMADETKLIQVLSNLLNNSFKFTSEGSIEFGYSIKGEVIEFFVKDTGIGIEPDKYQKIFERFYQVENATNYKVEGTGLGLSICKAYVELMGGKIWIESTPGKGATFYFTLPFYVSGIHQPERN